LNDDDDDDDDKFKITATKMKIMRRTAKHTWKDYKRSQDIVGVPNPDLY